MDKLEKYKKIVMRNHPDITEMEARSIAENLLSLAILAIDGYLVEKSSNNTIVIDK